MSAKALWTATKKLLRLAGLPDWIVAVTGV
jgi:hypothetical protein